MLPKFLKLKYENLLIIKNETNTVRKTNISLCKVASISNLLDIIKLKLTKIAPRGHGNPIKKSLLFAELNRASLKSTETKYNEAIMTPSSSHELIRKFTS